MANEAPFLIQRDPKNDRTRELAAAMMRRGQNSGPVRHWAQGLSRIADAWTGAYMNKKASNAETARQNQMFSELARAMSGGA